MAGGAGRETLFETWLLEPLWCYGLYSQMAIRTDRGLNKT